MCNTYGGILIPHCINCAHSFQDPETGYDCKEKHFPKVCEKYMPDAKFIMSECKKFIQRYNVSGK